MVLHTVIATALVATGAGFAARRTAEMALRKPRPETFAGAARRAVDIVKDAMVLFERERRARREVSTAHARMLRGERRARSSRRSRENRSHVAFCEKRLFTHFLRLFVHTVRSLSSDCERTRPESRSVDSVDRVDAL